MRKKEAIEYLLTRMSDDNMIVGIDLNKIVNREIEPELNEALRVLNFTMTPNGVVFNNDKRGFLPSLMAGMFNKRADVKDDMLNNQRKLAEVNRELSERGIN